MKPFENLENNFTLTHNSIFDIIMPMLSGNEFKILMLVFRLTRGWNKFTDFISLSQIRSGTGIKCDKTILKSIKRLERLDLILVNRGNYSANGQEPKANRYTINKDFQLENDDDNDDDNNSPPPNCPNCGGGTTAKNEVVETEAKNGTTGKIPVVTTGKIPVATTGKIPVTKDSEENKIQQQHASQDFEAESSQAVVVVDSYSEKSTENDSEIGTTLREMGIKGNGLTEAVRIAHSNGWSLKQLKSLSEATRTAKNPPGLRLSILRTARPSEYGPVGDSKKREEALRLFEENQRALLAEVDRQAEKLEMSEAELEKMFGWGE